VSVFFDEEQFIRMRVYDKGHVVWERTVPLHGDILVLRAARAEGEALVAKLKLDAKCNCGRSEGLDHAPLCATRLP
jgi:hypothetical protein